MRSSRHVRFAPKSARYLVTEVPDHLPHARALAVSAPLTATDGGDEGDYTLAVDGATSSARGVLKLAGQLGGTADLPDVRGLRVLDNAAPQLLTIGEVQDGEVLARSGTGLVGVSALSTGGGTVTGNIAMSGNKVTGLASGTDTGDAATYGQLTSMVNGLDWQQSVLDAISAPPGSPAPGDRYLVTATASGAWATHEEKIAQWTGSAWAFTVPNKGFTVHVEATGQDITYNGSHPAGSWVNIGASVDHASLLNLGTGNPHPQYQLGNAKGATDGYAGLDGTGRVPGTQAPPKSVYATGGNQAMVPGDIGAPPSARAVATGPGLGGGGDLSADRTLSIVAFTGLVARDHDPALSSWSANETKVHVTYDAGPDGMLVPVGLRLPATVDDALETEAVFEFHDASTRIVTNVSMASVLDDNMQGLANALMGDVTGAESNNGRSVRKVIFRTRNTTGSPVNDIDLGAFRLRAYAFPRGGGGAL